VKERRQLLDWLCGGKQDKAGLFVPQLHTLLLEEQCLSDTFQATDEETTITVTKKFARNGSLVKRDVLELVSIIAPLRRVVGPYT
jgi:hypothetical protein